MNLLFLDQNIIDILGLQNLDEEKKKNLLAKINKVVSERILFRIMDELSEGDKKDFDRLIQQQTGKQEIDKFLNGKINLQKIIMEEVTEFKERMAFDVQNLREALK